MKPRTVAAIANALGTGIDNLVYGSLHNTTDALITLWLKKTENMSPYEKTIAFELFISMLETLSKKRE